MDNSQSLLNILDFYTRANKLKTTLYNKKTDESPYRRDPGQLAKARKVEISHRPGDRISERTLTQC